MDGQNHLSRQSSNRSRRRYYDDLVQPIDDVITCENQNRPPLIGKPKRIPAEECHRPLESWPLIAFYQDHSAAPDPVMPVDSRRVFAVSDSSPTVLPKPGGRSRRSSLIAKDLPIPGENSPSHRPFTGEVPRSASLTPMVLGRPTDRAH